MTSVSRPQAVANATATAFRTRARELGKWVLTRLANRRDAYGQYLPLAARTNKRKAVVVRGTLTASTLARHFRGLDVGDLVGLLTTSLENTCRFVVVDIDQHSSVRDDNLKRRNRHAAIRLYDRAVAIGFQPLLLGSNGRGGYHLWIVFNEPVPSETAYCFIRWLVRDWRELGLESTPDCFPKQPALRGSDGIGNWIRLPGRHHTLTYWSRVWGGTRWLGGSDAVDRILATSGDSPSLIPRAAREFQRQPAVSAVLPSRDDDRHLRPIERVLARLAGVVDRYGQWSAVCPAHADHDPSLSVTEADDGRVLVHCFAGCEFHEIAEALQLKPVDFFPRRTSRSRRRRGRRR